MILQLSDLNTSDRQYWIQHIIAPRPIGLVSSIDSKGNINLSPFSFFNLFSADPPVIIFSPSRRVRNNTVKDTYLNVQETREVVINMVSAEMVNQVSLASCEYPKGTDEFIKAGLTRQPATLVKPPMVKESPAKLECRVQEIKSLGDRGGAGQLVICEVICMHINDDVLSEDKKAVPSKLKLVARLGGNYYCNVTSENLFEIEKPNIHCGIGIDALPPYIRRSRFLSSNQLAQLANVHETPTLDDNFRDGRLDSIFHYAKNSNQADDRQEQYAAELLNENKVDKAWQVLLHRVQEFSPVAK